MNKVQSLVLALTIGAIASGCASTGKEAATGVYFERRPASQAKSPLQEGTQVRVLRTMRMEAIDYNGSHGVYLSNGRALSLAEVREFNSSPSPQITQYCILYTERQTRKFALKEGDLLNLKIVPQETYWAPGHIYEIGGESAVKGVGCFMLSKNGANDVNEQLFRDQLGGIFEIVH